MLGENEFMKFKKWITGLTLCGLIVSGSVVAAEEVQPQADYSSYNGVVKKYGDLYGNSYLTKLNTTDAANTVLSKESGSLESWMENSSGDNLTEKAGYSSTGRKLMSWKDPSGQKGKNSIICISTSLTQFESVSTDGRYRPDSN